MKRLHIDTSELGKVKIKLQNEDKVSEKESVQQFGSQIILSLIEEMLKESGTKKEELNEIEVITGPGSFTGIRVGVSVANALGYALNIPVNGKKIETELVYK